MSGTVSDIVADALPRAGAIRCYGYVRKAAALVNCSGDRLSADRADAIIQAADEVISNWAIRLLGGRVASTGLNAPEGFGREMAVEIARKAQAEELTLKEAPLALGYLGEAELERIADPPNMIGNGVSGA